MKNARSPSLLRAFALQIFAGMLAVISACSAFAEDTALPFVSPMFGDNMVLQRNKPNTIWGWSKPGEEIRVSLAGKAAKTVAKADGSWSVAIQPPPVGGPYKLSVDGPQKVEFQNVLVGDVWLCGGQSNMEFGLTQALNAEEEIKAGDHPQIRLFIVKHQVGYAPKKIPPGAWKVCTPQNLAVGGWGGFSAVAYYFGLRLQKDLQVPIGLVEDCIGGTPAESWTSGGTLRTLKDFDAPLDEVAALKAGGAPEYGNFVYHWYDKFDPGQKDWFAPDLDDHDWKSVTLPGGFRDLGLPETPAVCYFRKTIQLPDPLPQGTAKILLGVVERMETTKINGRFVGESSWVENPRVYKIEEGILKPGANVITLRVLKTKPDGGFRSPPEKLKLVLGDNTEIPLADGWKGKVSVDARPPHPMPLGYENWPVMPSVLFNGMIAPVAPLALTGAIWYQGEANAERAEQYRKLLPAMIADWRKAFGQGDFPFYIVSLAAFTPRNEAAGADEGWARLREVQDVTAQTVPNSGLAVTIDIGDAYDIHPKNKKDVGERLAALALAKTYGKKVPFSGPRFASADPIAGALKIHFTDADGGLLVKGDKLAEFSVAGEDHVWHWAEARIEGDSVVVSSPEVPSPVAARYAWQSNPQATLFNGAGFPAVPFRTDRPLSSAKK